MNNTNEQQNARDEELSEAELDRVIGGSRPEMGEMESLRNASRVVLDGCDQNPSKL